MNSNEELSLQEILYTLYKWKKYILLGFIALAGLTFFLQQSTSTEENIYKATSQIRIQGTFYIPSFIRDIGVDIKPIKFDVEAEEKKVISEENLKTALSILGWELTSQNISKVRNSIRISSSSRQNIISIEAYSQSPLEAKDIANAVAEAYVRNSTTWFLKAIDSSLEFLKASSIELGSRLKDTYSELGRLSEKTGIINPDVQLSYEIRRIKEINEKISEIDSKISTIEELFSAISRAPDQTKRILSNPETIFMKDGIPESKEAIETIKKYIGKLIAVDESIAETYKKYTELEKKRDELLLKFSEKHPAIAEIDKQTTQMFDDVLVKARITLAKLKTERKKAELEIQEAREKIKQISSNISEYYYLANNVDILSRILENYSNALLELKMNSAMLRGIAEVYRSATVPTEPVRKNFRNLIISLLVAGAGSILIAFMLESLDTRFKTPEDIVLSVKVPIAGIIYKSNKVKDAVSDIRYIDKLLYEKIRSIRINLVLSAYSRNLKILVCSSLPEEGKTFVSYNLATSFAEVGFNTALLDLNLRHNYISTKFQIQDEKSFIHYLEKTKSLEDIKYKIKDNLDLYGLAPNISVSPDIISSRAFSEFIKDLSNKHEIIISDSPPLLIPDILPAVKLFDIVLIVYDASRTGARTLRRIVNSLREAGAKDMKIVANKVEPELKSFYYYPYHNRYIKKYYYEEDK